MKYTFWRFGNILYRNILASKCLQNVIRTLVCLTFAWLKAFDNKDLIGGDIIDEEKDDRFRIIDFRYCVCTFSVFISKLVLKSHRFFIPIVRFSYFQLVFFMTWSKKCVMSELSQFIAFMYSIQSNLFFLQPLSVDHGTIMWSHCKFGTFFAPPPQYNKP